MPAVSNNAQTTAAANGAQLNPIKPIDIGFRWIDDVTIELKNRIPDTKLYLKVTADTGTQRYEIREGKLDVIRPVLHHRISCNETKEPVIELFEYRHKHVVLRDKVSILSMKVPLKDDELYTEKTQTSNDDGAIVTLTFAYTPGGELRNQVENARRITEEQKVVLDKIKHVHRFFQGLEKVCDAVDDIHPYIKTASTSVLLLYKLCERQKECRDAARDLVDEMDTFLSSGAEALGSALRTNSITKSAFRSLAAVIEDICKFIKERSAGMAGSLLRGAVSTSYESKLKELKENLAKVKEGLRDSLSFVIWKRVLNSSLRDKLESVLRAHYSPGEGCLENTRKALLLDLDTWLRGTGDEKVAWVHGHAGSGKSALLNSIAESLENAEIPFTCFPCKRDDPDLSNIHKILATIAYIFAEYYGDYGGLLSDLFDRNMGRSVLTGNIKKQGELLFGELYELISPKRANRPSVHVILIDALDECRNHHDGGKSSDERRALLDFFFNFAHAIPWIKVLITSRPEPDIVDAFTETTSAIHRININDDKWGTSADIRLFIEAQSRNLKLSLSTEQIIRLQEKAGNLFVWCATVFRYIKVSKRSREELISDILNASSSWTREARMQRGPFDSLYALYQRVLDSAVLNSEDRLTMDSVLGVVFVASSRRSLSSNAIADILYPSEQGEGKRVWVSNIVESLSAIIYVEWETNAVRTYHPSALDFIGGLLTGGFPEISPIVTSFSIGMEQAHERAFEGCFTIINRDLRANICELEDSLRLNKDVPELPALIAKRIAEALQYASLFWLSHLEQSGYRRSTGRVLVFLSSLKVLFWVEVLSLMDVVDRGIVILQDCARLFSDQPSVVKIADEWERFLLAYGDASKSTPHLYLSALSWLPGSSQLWHIVRGSFSSGLPLISNVPEAWNCEKWSENVGASVYSVAYSADGRLFADGCFDGKVRLWEARSGKVAREPFVSEGEVWSIAFSPNNRWLASGHGDHNVRLWDLHFDSAEPRVLEGHTSWVRSVSFSLDSKRIVSGSDDRTIRVWDVESTTAIGSPFSGHNNNITSVAFSADNTRIISGSFDETVRIWDSQTGEQIREPLQGHLGDVNSIACSRDGKFIASGSSDYTIILWDAQTYDQICDPLAGHIRRINSVCFSADDRRLVSGSDDHSICIWSVEARSLVCVLQGHTDSVFSVAFSQDGQDILSGSLDNTVRVWNAKETASAVLPSKGRSTNVSCVSYVPNSSLVVSASYDGSIYLWDMHTGAAVGVSLQGRAAAVNSLAVSSDGLWIVSGSSDNVLRIWDIASRSPVGEPLLAHTGTINSVAISPDNCFIASASNDDTVRLWDVATRKLVRTFKGHEQRVLSVTFSMDGDRMISGSSDHTVRIWETRTGEEVGHPLKGHSNWVRAVTVSPDGKLIASASDDFSVRIWSMLTLSEVHVFRGHSGFVMSIAFSGDSQFLISGSRDRTVRVWNAYTSEAVGNPLTGHTGWINSVTFSPDGHEFACGSQDGTLRIWDTRARTDLELYGEGELDYSELDEEAFRIRWNASRASTSENDGWIKDGKKLLLWVPWQHRNNIKNGLKLVIRTGGKDTLRPKPDHRKVLKYTGARWKDIYAASGPSKEPTMLI